MTATLNTTTCPPCTTGAERTCSATCAPVANGDSSGQLWAAAVADTLTAAHHAATTARQSARTASKKPPLATLPNQYLGTLAKGRTDNLGDDCAFGGKARTLIRRFLPYQDMILWFTADLAIPWTNTQAEHYLRPVKSSNEPREDS